MEKVFQEGCGSDGLSIKDDVLRYQRTGEGLERIIEHLSEQIYSYPLKKGTGGEDDAGDFYLFFLPKLKRLLLRYRDRNIPFEHYFCSVLCWNLKSYFKQRKQRGIKWQAAASREFWADQEPAEADYDEPYLNEYVRHLFRIRPDKKIENASSGRRFLFLVLRHVRYVNSRHLELISRITGYEVTWLRERVANLKNTLLPKERRLEVLRTRRNRAFYRSRLLEIELAREMVGDRRRLLEQRLTRLRRVMSHAAQEISRVPLAPTHRAIAEELGIPKGTVDTGLRWVKKNLILLYQDERMEYA